MRIKIYKSREELKNKITLCNISSSTHTSFVFCFEKKTKTKILVLIFLWFVCILCKGKTAIYKYIRYFPIRIRSILTLIIPISTRIRNAIHPNNIYTWILNINKLSHTKHRRGEKKKRKRKRIESRISNNLKKKGDKNSINSTTY